MLQSCVDATVFLLDFIGTSEVFVKEVNRPCVVKSFEPMLLIASFVHCLRMRNPRKFLDGAESIVRLKLCVTPIQKMGLIPNEILFS